MVTPPSVARPAARDWLWLALILALATGLRLRNLGAPLWFDEIVTVMEHLRLDWGRMLSSYSMNYHYLHNLQAKIATQIWGEQIWAIRLPSLVFGLGSIVATWALAWRIAGRSAAHLTAALMALSFHHIWFSQNARGYTELAFWGTLGMIFFLSGLARPRPGIWLAYGLTLTLATYTHLTGAFLYAAQGLVWLGWLAAAALRRVPLRERFLFPALGYVFGGLLTLILYIPTLPGMLSTLGGVAETSAVDVMQEYQNPLWTIAEGIRTGLGAAGPLVAAVAALVIALVTIGAAVCRRAPLFGPIVLMHVVVTVILLTVAGMRIWPRFFFADVGFILLLIVLGVQAVCGWMAGWTILAPVGRWLFPLAAAAMLLISAGLAARNYIAPKQDLIGAVTLVEAERQPGERVYAAGPAWELFHNYFGMDWAPLDSGAQWQAAVAEPGPFLLVVAFPGRMLRTIPGIEAAETAGTLTLVKAFPGTLGDGYVLVYRRGQDG
jgi:uncharacterized membrane protein